MTIINNTRQANLVSLGTVHTIRLMIDPDVQLAGPQTIAGVPASACVIDAGVVVMTAFDGTAPAVSIGTEADPDGLATELVLTAAGRIVADEMTTSDDLHPIEDTLYVAEVGGIGSTVGAGYVYVSYIAGND